MSYFAYYYKPIYIVALLVLATLISILTFQDAFLVVMALGIIYLYKVKRDHGDDVRVTTWQIVIYTVVVFALTWLMRLI